MDFKSNESLSEYIKLMTDRITEILSDCEPSVYLYGSVTMDDFKYGWSDIDILVLTQKTITEKQAEELVRLRQKMAEECPDNLYFCLFEGGMLSVSGFMNKTPDRVVYWGTSGQRITDSYTFDSFSMAELLENGILLFGNDIRCGLEYPAYESLRFDVERHYNAIRRYAQTTDRSLYSFGWLLDIARCIYTLRTGKIIAKTKAGEWALKNGICPVSSELEKALSVRKNPTEYLKDVATFDYAETLGPAIQKFADVLEKELNK